LTIFHHLFEDQGISRQRLVAGCRGTAFGFLREVESQHPDVVRRPDANAVCDRSPLSAVQRDRELRRKRIFAIRSESVAYGGSYIPVLASGEITRRNSLSRLSCKLASVQENASDASGRRICGRQGSQQLPGGFVAASFAAFYSAQEQIEGIDLDGPSCHITFETVSSDWLPGSAHNFPGESR
jgi:hypothetical protein